jgi:hypothetical protein
MYQLPDKSQLTPLIGQRAIQICCTINTLSVHFENDSMIDVYDRFECEIRDGMTHDIVFPISDLSIFQFLECEIADIAVEDDQRTLSLLFENGWLIRFSSSPAFESFRLRLLGKEYLI